MTRNWAIALSVLLLAIVAWGLLVGADVSVTLNGEQLTGSFKGVVATGGFIVAAVAFFCVAILLVFVFSGVGLIVLGCLLLTGLIIATIAVPVLFPLLAPLVIVWVFIAATKREKHD